MHNRMQTQPATEYRTAPLLSDAVALFLNHRQHAGLSAGTLTQYTHHLTTWRRWRSRRGYPTQLADITIGDLRSYITYLQTEHMPYQGNPNRRALRDGARLAPATIGSIWRTLRTAWNFWIDEGLLSDAQALFFQRNRIPKPKVPNQIRQTYAIDVITALLTAADRSVRVEQARRDRALLLLLHDTGMRISELCDLSDEHLNFPERQAIVHGKGDKERYVFWTARTSGALIDYLAVRRGAAGGPLFRGCSSRNNGNRLTSDAVRGILGVLAQQAGVELVPGAPVHALRHTFAHRFLDNGGDGLHLQQLLGHESSETTERYVRENPTGLRRAYRKAFE